MDKPIMVSKECLQQIYRSLKGAQDSIHILERLLYPACELTERVERVMRVESYRSQARR